MSDTWLLRPAARPQAGARLFCFPYAGAGASAFGRWHLHLPQDVELWAVQLPGRETRLRELPLRDLGAVADEIARRMLPLLDRPFAVFGHSMGALTAFETVRRLRAHALAPSVLFVSGKGAPHCQSIREELGELSDDDFIAAIDRLYGGVPTLLKDDPEFRQLYLPALRADVAAVCHHRHTEAPPLECSLHVLGGQSDRTAPPESLDAWRRYTVGEFRVHLFPGDHFFVQTARVAVLDLVAAELAQRGARQAVRQ